MKRKCPLSIVLLLLSIVSVISIAIYIKNSERQGQIHCETILGDKSSLDGIKITTVSTADNDFDMKQTIEFGEKDYVSTDITTYFHNTKSYGNFMFGPSVSTDGQIEELKRRFRTENTEIQLCKVIPYIYPNIQFFPDAISLGTTKRPPKLKIKTPDNVYLQVNKDEYDNIYYSGMPMYDIECCYEKIGNTLYFTYLNGELNEFEYEGERTHLDYEGVSGLFSIPVESDDTQIAYFNDSFGGMQNGLKSHIEIPVSDDSQVVVIGMDAVFNKTSIALSVVEDSSLYIYLYRITDNCMLGKYKIMDFTKEQKIDKVRVCSNDDLLMVKGECQSGDRIQLFFGAGRLDGEMNYESVLSQKIYDPQVSEVLEGDGNLEIVDMLYQKDTLYCLISYWDRRYPSPHSYNYMLSVSGDGIVYFARVWTDFSEDMTIGVQRLDLGNFFGLQYRTYGNLQFIKNNG